MGQHMDHIGLEELPQHGAEHLEGKQSSWGQRTAHSAGNRRASTHLYLLCYGAYVTEEQQLSQHSGQVWQSAAHFKLY